MMCPRGGIMCPMAEIISCGERCCVQGEIYNEILYPLGIHCVLGEYNVS